MDDFIVKSRTGLAFKKILRNWFDRLAGRVEVQPFFEQLHRLSLLGMNIGGSVDVQSNGEKLVVQYLADYLNKQIVPVVFDVGANVGKYALNVLAVFGEDVDLYCFEPSKTAFAELSQNLRNYKRAKICNFGFGARKEVVSLYTDSPGSGMGSIFNRRVGHLDIEMKYKEEIELTRLDDFCREQGINHIHLLKLDVEGNELNVLEGASELLTSRSIDLIQFEFGGCNIDSRTYFQDFFYLLHPTYRIHRIVGSGLRPIDKYKESYEIFMTVNYLAISRNILERSF